MCLEHADMFCDGCDIVVKFKLLNRYARLPQYATPGSAGMDLFAALQYQVVIHRNKRVIIPTGLAVEIPVGFEAQIRPRSGNALKYGITVLNSPGTIDSDYRGEIGVMLINHGEDCVLIEPGDRIAQMVIAPVMRVKIVQFDELCETARGAGGFGSTGR